MDRPVNNGVKYIISDDPDFDVARLKSINGAPFIKIYDVITGRCVEVREQEYKNLYSHTVEELRRILEAIIYRNAQLSKAELIELLRNSINSSINKFIDDLNIVNFKGYADVLPTEDVLVGDVWVVDNHMFICECNDKNNIVWRKIYTTEDLAAYYTKVEFEHIYVEHMQLIDSMINGQLYGYSEEFKQRFISKEDAEAWKNETTKKVEKCQNYINEILNWRNDIQVRVDELTEILSNIRLNQEAIVNDWIERQKQLIAEKLTELNGVYASLNNTLNKNTETVRILSTEVSILNRALSNIRNGKQQVLEERYEA